MKKRIKKLLKRLQAKPHQCRYKPYANLLHCEECGDTIFSHITTTMGIKRNAF
jgi:hypothetical protein